VTDGAAGLGPKLEGTTMETAGSDTDRTVALRAAVANVPSGDLRAALSRPGGAPSGAAKAAVNALNALRRHRDPAAVADRPQYRAALPYLAALVAEECLARTVDALGDHSEDPTREQLLEAVEEVRGSFPDTTIAVMLASVAHDDLPSSALCAQILGDDPRFGLTDLDEEPGSASATEGEQDETTGTTPEQRAARRAKKEKAAAERRRKAEMASRAEERVRRARKAERARARPSVAHPTPEEPGGGAPRSPRRAMLTPAEEEEFDRHDPWVGGVVFVWVPFESVDLAEPDLEGKARRCVVVAGSPAHLLVRPGYSVGGTKSRDWKAVPLRDWRQAGFDRPTFIDVHAVRAARPAGGTPVGWLSTADWNALW
jgi:hypothetical protein